MIEKKTEKLNFPLQIIAPMAVYSRLHTVF